MHNIETRLKYGAGPRYSLYCGAPGSREGQFIHITVPWYKRGLDRWKNGIRQTVGPKIQKNM